jgi:hypothetical protein
VGQPERVHETDREFRSRAQASAAPVPALAADVLSLQRQLGNRNTVRLLARDPVTMRPTTITSTQQPVERGVSGLDQLRGVGANSGEMSIERDAATIGRNSPQADRALPFTGTDGWDAQAILTVLGQYDTSAQTDSDALRCVQAVALASRIVRGPAAVTSFLSSATLDGMLSTSLGARQRTAIAVLRYVKDRIEARRASFGDLSWAQEALHDLYYDDVSGTPLSDILRRVSPLLDLTFTTEARSTWLATPDAVVEAASPLQEGEQLLLNTWEVAFNEAFLELEDQHVQTPVGGSQVVNMGGHDVRIRRIDASHKPPHTAIDTHRDRMHGHQLLIIKDAAVGGLRLYDPEVSDSGRHLHLLTAGLLAPYFRDLPDIQIYSYMEILGKLTPSRIGG